MTRSLLTASAAAIAAAVASPASADTLLSETFETNGNGSRYTTSIAEYSDGGSDYFTRTSVNGGVETGTSALTGSTGFFFAAQDIDDGGKYPGPQTLTFRDIDIAGYQNLTLSLSAAENASTPCTQSTAKPVRPAP